MGQLDYSSMKLLWILAGITNCITIYIRMTYWELSHDTNSGFLNVHNQNQISWTAGTFFHLSMFPVLCAKCYEWRREKGAWGPMGEDHG